MNVLERIAIEKQVVRKLIRVAKAKGYNVVKVYDGEEMVKVKNETEAMDNVFGVDEATIYFKKDGEPKAHCALIVLGNDGWDAIADNSMGEGWDDVMAEVDEYCDELCLKNN